MRPCMDAPRSPFLHRILQWRWDTCCVEHGHADIANPKIGRSLCPKLIFGGRHLQYFRIGIPPGTTPLLDAFEQRRPKHRQKRKRSQARVLVATLAFPAFADADNVKDIQVGKELAMKVCSPCHVIPESMQNCGVRSQPSPHFLHNREGLIDRFVLVQIFVKSRNKRPQPGVRHVCYQLIEHAALPEQRMSSVFGGVDLEMAVHAEAFAGRAEQRQKHDGEGVQKKQPVAPLRIGDA